MVEAAQMLGALRHEVVLPTGRLSIRVDKADWSLERLCGYAARHNARRGFLFISKVLGKHWPSAPTEMAAAHHKLASQIPGPCARPALFVGMAETATGLGQGVFESYLAQHGLGSAMYVQTTRYPLSGAQKLDFSEVHSHAQSLRLHLPQEPALRQIFLHASTVVLVDDELSTGNTFRSLFAAYSRLNAGVERICLVALTDFMGPEARLRWRQQFSQVDFISLLSGAIDFAPDSDFSYPALAPAQAHVECRRSHVGPFSARLGTDKILRLPLEFIDRLCKRLPSDKPILVLGTGEFMHPAFCLARTLVEGGRQVCVQATTRSPIMLGADVKKCITLQDPFGEGIPNYLYNVEPHKYTVLLCCENPHSVALQDTLTRLDATLVDLGSTL